MLPLASGRYCPGEDCEIENALSKNTASSPSNSYIIKASLVAIAN